MIGSVPLLLALSAPHIDLYTMGQGEALFERFGHAAVCVVYDDQPARTRCYNYGTTDFGSPPSELGWRFLRGTSRFWVSVWTERRMIDTYVKADRSVWRQRLPLSAERARWVAAKLSTDAEPANRYYRYHHFDDNCATRLRDIIDEASDGRLSRNAEEMPWSYRELGRRALADQPEALLAGDLLVGRRADELPTRYEAMFLPRVLRAEVAERLHAPVERVYTRKGPSFPRQPASVRFWFAVAGVVMALPLLASARRPRAWRGVLGVVGVMLGALGALVWGVAAISQVPELTRNEAVLVFWPSDALLGFVPWRLAVRYARIRVAVLAVLSGLLAVGGLRQPLLLPLLMAALPLLVVALEGARPLRSALQQGNNAGPR